MGELRLYAIGIDEVRDMFGAPDQAVGRLREQARAAFVPQQQPAGHTGGLLAKLGPIFRRVPGAPVLDPEDPGPEDVDRLLAGGYVPADRNAATWRVLEVLIRANAWGSTALTLTGEQLDDLDFALARGGVHAAAGLRHLLTRPTELPLIPPPGLLVGFHTGDQATWMAASYREALTEIDEPHHRNIAYALANWLDGFSHWEEMAAAMDRPTPDLLGLWTVG